MNPGDYLCSRWLALVFNSLDVLFKRCAAIKAQLHCAVKIILGLYVLAENRVGQRPIRMRKGRLGVETEGVVVVLEGPLVLPQFTVSISSLSVRHGPKLGVETDGLVVVLNGPLVLPRSTVGVASIDVGVRVFGV